MSFSLQQLQDTPVIGAALNQVPGPYMDAVGGIINSLQSGGMPGVAQMMLNGGFDQLKALSTKDLFKGLMSGMTGMPWEHIAGLAQNPHQPLWEMYPHHYQNPWMNNSAASGQVRG
jgi:hypothetical protein